MVMVKYKILSHTADLRLEVYGATLEELFVNAAEALARVLVGKKPLLHVVAPSEQLKIKSENINALLVDFLNEILAKSQINKAVYKVKSLSVIASPNASAEAKQSHLEAALSGTAVLEFSEDVKAVTYHEANIKKEGEIYKARLVLDI